MAVPAGQGKLRQQLHRTKKIGLYFRGVNDPPLQPTIVSSYVALYRNFFVKSKFFLENSLINFNLNS